MIIKNNNENLYFKSNINKIYKKNTVQKILKQNNIAFKGPVNKNGLKFICNVASRTYRFKNTNQITFTQLQRKTICDFMQNCSYGYSDIVKHQLPYKIQSLYIKKNKNEKETYTQCNIKYELPKNQHIGACQNLAKQLYDYLNKKKEITDEFDLTISKGLYASKHDRMSHFFVTLSPKDPKTFLVKPQVVLDPSFNTVVNYNPITFHKYMFAKPFNIDNLKDIQNIFSLENNVKQPFGFAKELLKKCPEKLHNNLIYFDFSDGKTNFYIHSNSVTPFMTNIPRENLKIDLSYLENIEENIENQVKKGEYEPPKLIK